MFDECNVQSVVMSLVDMGIPSHRPRPYTLVQPNPACKLFGRVTLDVDHLKAVAFRRLCLKGSIFLQASPDMVHEFLNDMASNRGLDRRNALVPYSCRSVMPSGDRVRLDSIKQKLIDDGITDFDYNAGVTQTANFSSCLQVMPTLLKHTILYNLRAERLYLPDELMAVQGFPNMLPENDPLRRLMPADEWLGQLRCDLTDNQLQAVLGNSMALSQLGTIIAVVFAAAAAEA